MGALDFIADYFAWHYSEAIKDLLEIEKNFMRFAYHLFSMPLLFKTLFAPIFRLNEKRKLGFDLEAASERFIVNTIMRIVGFFVRLIFLVLGAIIEIILAFISIPILLFWLLAPMAAIILFFAALFYLI